MRIVPQRQHVGSAVQEAASRAPWIACQAASCLRCKMAHAKCCCRGDRSASPLPADMRDESHPVPGKTPQTRRKRAVAERESEGQDASESPLQRNPESRLRLGEIEGDDSAESEQEEGVSIVGEPATHTEARDTGGRAGGAGGDNEQRGDGSGGNHEKEAGPKARARLSLARRICNVLGDNCGLAPDTVLLSKIALWAQGS